MAKHTEEETQYEIFEMAKRRDIKPGKLFKTTYLLLLGKPRGPKLGPFLLALNSDFVAKRLGADHILVSNFHHARLCSTIFVSLSENA